MSFTIRLTSDLISAEAGATVPVSIEIENKGSETDRFEMQVEGIDPEWTASPEPVFTVGPGETHVQKVFFKPPRVSESLAGNYPFVIRVRSLNSGEARTSQGVLQIKPFHHLSMEITPKKGYVTPMRHQNTFGLTIINLGNTEHTLQLSGADPEEACTYEFAQDQVTVGPGQQKDMEVTVHTANPGLVASSRLFGFGISGRSIQNSNVVTSTQGQLEQRPLMSMGTLAMVILLLGIAAAWFALKPQPATVRLFAEKTTVQQGETATIKWRGANADSIKLEISHNKNGANYSNENITDQPLEGEHEITIKDEDTITVKAIAMRDNKEAYSTNLITINVQALPEVKPPVINEFSANRRTVNLGESVVLTFKYSSDTDHLVIEPLNEQIMPPAKSYEFTPTSVGSKSYSIIAYTKEGKASTPKEIKVQVVQNSEARILAFSASPTTLQAPDDVMTTISWQVTNAARVEFQNEKGTFEPVEATGSRDVLLEKTTTFKILAKDAKGISTSQVITVTVKPAPPPPPTSTTGDTGGDTTGGGTTGGDTGGSTTTGGQR